jgi:serine/threonine protein kinase
MAAVYEASGTGGERCAVKLLHPELARRSDVRERFLREAYVANRISHPAVAKVLEHGGGEGAGVEEPFIAMELLVGETLAERTQRLGKLELDKVLDVLDQVLDVLTAAHALGVVHRDLKPDNLFITEQGQVKVLDFGVARLLDDVPGDLKTRTGMALGTLPYMAPEQALGRRAEIDGRVDLFALGATAFRMLSGRKIHEEGSEAALLIAMATKPAPPLASVAPQISAEACTVVDLALAFSKEARYPDARTMREDVQAVRHAQPPPYASTLSTAREQATRIDLPAVAASPAIRTPTVQAPAVQPAAAVRTPTVHAPAAQPAAAVRTPTVKAPSPAPEAIARTPTVPAPIPASSAASAPARTPTVQARSAESIQSTSAQAPAPPALSEPQPLAEPSASKSTRSGRRLFFGVLGALLLTFIVAWAALNASSGPASESNAAGSASAPEVSATDDSEASRPTTQTKSTAQTKASTSRAGVFEQPSSNTPERAFENVKPRGAPKGHGKKHKHDDDD